MLMVNLLPWRDKHVINIKILSLIIIILLMTLIAYIKYKTQQQYLSQLLTEIHTKELMKKPLLNSIQTIDELKQSAFNAFIIKFHEIQFTEISLESIQYKNNSVILIGEALSLKALANFLANLNNVFQKAYLDEVYQSAEKFKKFKIQICLQ